MFFRKVALLVRVFCGLNVCVLPSANHLLILYLIIYVTRFMRGYGGGKYEIYAWVSTRFMRG